MENKAARFGNSPINLEVMSESVDNLKTEMNETLKYFVAQFVHDD